MNRSNRAPFPFTPLRRKRVVSGLFRWYRAHGRDLPWRDERDPYRIVVSEIMLQQTQVSRVLLKYPSFIRRFPSVKCLARSRASSVIKAWRGMGYNNRSLRLRRLARLIESEHGGSFPRTVEQLEKLPGIGRYTASATACFAFGARVPVVDTNISRVLRRLASATRNPRTTANEDWQLAEMILPRRRAGDWHQALMDLGSTLCTATSPQCGRCPLVRHCPSAHSVIRSRKLKTRREPEREGVPNRIYRGRVVEVLRNLKRNEYITLIRLARTIKPNYRTTDRRWFEKLVTSLKRDDLLQLRTRSKVSLVR